MAIINGTPNNDILVGTSGDDIITTNQGRDDVDGGAGVDRLVVDISSNTVHLFNTVYFENGSLRGTVGNLNAGIGEIRFSNIELLDLTLGRANEQFQTIVNEVGAQRVNVDGGEGIDQLIISMTNTSSAALALSITANRIAGDLGTFTNFESLQLGGSEFDDRITVTGSGFGLLEINGRLGDDIITGGDDGSFLDGGLGDDIVAGGSGNDFISVGDTDNFNLILGEEPGADVVNAGAGDDKVILGPIASGSSINGGSGNDRLQLYLGPQRVGVNVDFVIMAAGGISSANGISFSGFERLDSGQHLLTFGDDILRMTADFGGDIFLAAGQGNDLVVGGAGNDTLAGQDGNNVVDGGAGNDVVSGEAGNDTLDGGDGNDQLLGGGGVDTLRGGAGDDQITAFNLAVGTVIDGGAGYDVLTLSFSNTGGSVDLDFSAATPGGTVSGNGVTISGIDEFGAVSLANGNDRLLFGVAYTLDLRINANDGNDMLTSGSGNDIIDGGAGDDQINGGAGNDLLLGQVGNDIMDGGGGNDDIRGGAGSDTLRGGAGDDLIVMEGPGGTVDGGAGIDRVQLLFANAASGANVDATALASSGTFVMNGVTSTNVELIDFEGSRFDDRFVVALEATQRNFIDAGAGNDIVMLGAGNDQIRGGDGIDQLSGNGGNDGISGDAGDDRLFGGAGLDTILGGDGNDIVEGGEDDDQLGGGAGNDTVRGGSGNDRIFGETGLDTLEGGDGNDILFAATGGGFGGPVDMFQDRLNGGNGDDQITIGLNDIADGGSGFDIVSIDGTGATEGFTLDLSQLVSGQTIAFGTGSLAGFEGYAEIKLTEFDDVVTIGSAQGGSGNFDGIQGFGGNDRLTGGTGIDRLFGSFGDDILIGLAANDYLVGSEGTDFLDGGDGNDELLAGEGNDRILAGAGDDIVKGESGDDSIEGGAGDDRVDAGAGADVVDGGAGNDEIFGDGFGFGAPGSGQIGGNDILTGGDGDDRLLGGGGTNLLYGGSGNDIYNLEGVNDITFEDAGGGIDTVLSSTSHYLFANLENLTLFGGAFFGVGTGVDNVIIGNDIDNLLIACGGADTVNGGFGNDLIFGEDGDDELNGGGGVDFVVGGAGNDRILGGTGADALYGEDGNDHLDAGGTFDTDILVGGAGDDVLYAISGIADPDFDLLDGGNGNDSYYVDTGADLTFEGVGGGIDTVFADVSVPGAGVYLYANVENLVLLSQTRFGVGNELDNHITGSAFDNLLLGGAGSDTIIGGGGVDVLFGEGGSDTFGFGGSTASVIGDYQVGIDRLDLRGLGFTSFADVLDNMTQVNGSSAIDLGEAGIAILLNVAIGQLTAGDFLI